MRPRDYNDGLDADGYPIQGPGRIEPTFEDTGPNCRFSLLYDVVKNNVIPFFETILQLRPQCESPIELTLGAHLIAALKGTNFQLVPQYKWRGFRNDFAIIGPNGVVFFIECDGKEFHSTPEQVARDRRKDSAAKADGIPLLRFTGSEIFHNAKWISKIIREELERVAK